MRGTADAEIGVRLAENPGRGIQRFPLFNQNTVSLASPGGREEERERERERGGGQTDRETDRDRKSSAC